MQKELYSACDWPAFIPLISVLQTHLNPCFIQTNIVASPQPLEKDQWHCLKEGDIFSLMPGKFVYRVRLKEEDQTLRWFSLLLKAAHLLFNNNIRAESGWPCDDVIWQCATCLQQPLYSFHPLKEGVNILLTQFTFLKHSGLASQIPDG